MLRRVLQHVSIEVAPGDKERMLAFWRVVGFEKVEAPEALGDYVDWVECAGTQIHLIYTEEATVPVLGHPAVVAPDFEETVARLRNAGFEFEESRQLWGARRGFAVAPGGQRVELMASPPPASR
jgi:catechol 2,3-dioxygenase-like lactoylglutathione lyase family enzyme